MRKKLHLTPLEYAQSMTNKHGYNGFENMHNIAFSEMCNIHFSAHPFKRTKTRPINEFIRSAFIDYNNHNGIENK